MFRNFIDALPPHTAKDGFRRCKRAGGKRKAWRTGSQTSILMTDCEKYSFCTPHTKRIDYHLRNQGNENGEHTNEDCHVTGWQFVTSRSQQHFVQVITPNWHAALGVKGCNGAPRRIRCEILLQGLDTFRGTERLMMGLFQSMQAKSEERGIA